MASAASLGGLTAGQIATIKKVYGGVKTSDGKVFAYGFPMGHEGGADGWRQWIKSIVAKGQAKQAEIEAVGLDDYLQHLRDQEKALGFASESISTVPIQTITRRSPERSDFLDPFSKSRRATRFSRPVTITLTS